MTIEARKDFNWTPLVIAGAATGGLYLIWRIMRTMTEGSEADRKLAEEIMADWYVEWEGLRDYSEQIYYMDRIPSDHELAIMSALTNQMASKERMMEDLSTPTLIQWRQLVEAIGQEWWKVPATLASFIAGYGAIELIKGWKNRRGPPPNFPCPHGDYTGGTAGDLKNHFETTHEVIAAGALEAQVDFHKLSTWVQGSVAVESVYGRVYDNWGTIGLSDLRSITWGIVSTYVYGIATLTQMSILWTMVFALTPF